MDITHTIDYVARTSDEAAVRAQFDARTYAWLRVIAIISILVSFPHAIAGMPRNDFPRLALGAASFALALTLALSMRKKANHAVARFIRARVRGVAIGYVLAQTSLLALFHSRTEGSVAIPIMIALLVVGYRLLPAEHVLLHIGLAAIPTIIVLIFPHPREQSEAMYAPVMVSNMMFLMVSLFISRRAKRNIVADWTERRVSAREQIRMRDELRYARELQLSMLPECAPRLDWADLCAISVPATEVGGDYYDYFVDKDRVAIVCGDVAGHGMAAGLVLAALRTGFTLMRDSLDDPAVVLRRLHDLVAETSRRRMLVTVTVVLLDRRTMQATIASAGHPPVILFRAEGGGSVETIELYAPPLGVRLPVEIPQRRIDVKPGDVFVLHSDGVYETRNPADAVYGMERLAAIVHEQGYGSAEELRDAIITHLERFRGDAPQDDDVTVVVAKMV